MQLQHKQKLQWVEPAETIAQSLTNMLQYASDHTGSCNVHAVACLWLQLLSVLLSSCLSTIFVITWVPLKACSVALCHPTKPVHWNLALQKLCMVSNDLHMSSEENNRCICADSSQDISVCFMVWLHFTQSACLLVQAVLLWWRDGQWGTAAEQQTAARHQCCSQCIAGQFNTPCNARSFSWDRV